MSRALPCASPTNSRRCSARPRAKARSTRRRSLARRWSSTSSDAEGWAWVQLARDGYVGYLPSESLRAETPEPSHRVAATRSFVYPARTMKAPPLMALAAGRARQRDEGARRLRRDRAVGLRLRVASGDVWTRASRISSRSPSAISTRLISGAARRGAASIVRASCRVALARGGRLIAARHGHDARGARRRHSL